MTLSNVLSSRALLGALLTSSLAMGACKGTGSGDAETDTEGSDTDGASSDGSGSGGTDGGDDSGGGDDGGGDDGGGDDTGEPDDVPHARGTIVLGESHPPQSSNSSPIVTATFVPDYHAQPDACGEDVAGCFVQTAPDCQGQCETDEFCAFNDSCQATCQRYCDLACGPDEVCYFPIPDNPACKKIEYFDAGALNFTGTTVPVTLFPPYQFQGDVTGALFLPGSEVTVHASGTNDAGFEAFDISFTTTDYLQTRIEEIGLEELYGTGPLPVAWTAGQDDVRVSLTVSGLTGGYGTVTCDAPDTTGEFGVPREAIEAALGEEEGLSSIHLSVERRRSEIHKGQTTTGKLLEQTVQPDGWVEVVSTSVESTTLLGCEGLGYCGGECVDVLYNDAHCGACGNACSAVEYCDYGDCISACNYGEVPCGNTCVNTDYDENHCGACNSPCAGECVGGECINDTGGDSGGDSGGDPGGGSGDCCTAHGGLGCSVASIETCVCNTDAYCCQTAWDGTCANEVESLNCGTC